MQVYWHDGSVTDTVGSERVVAGLGFFDGVHLGHQAILLRVKELAEKMDALSVMVTFDRHPLEIIRPDAVPKLLTSARERRAYVWELGIAAMAELGFNQQLARLEPKEFASRILARQLGVIAVVAGDDFRFGYRGQGGVSLLRQAGPGWGIEATDVVEPISIKGARVSSTGIRGLLREGKVEEAAECLGRPYRLSGPVIAGEGRGRKLGFPTANLAVPTGRLIPRDGVYAVTVRLIDERSDTGNTCVANQARMIGVLSIGDKPTFAGTERSIEAHVLDRQESYYGKELEVSFYNWLRPSQRFESAEALKDQVERDIKVVRRLLGPTPSAMGGKIYSHRAL